MNKKALGQYFTPRKVADLMVSLLESPKDASILEPSAGEGVFLDALTEAGFDDLTAVEIDPNLLKDTSYNVEHRSFVTWQKPHDFDIVIGNPPYIRWKNMDSKQQDEVKEHHLWGTLFNSLSDYLTVFIANAVEMMKSGSELVFITPSFWLQTLHSRELRKWLLQQGAFTDIIDFGESTVFPGVSSHILIFRFQKKLKQNITQIKRWKYCGKRKLPDLLNLDDTSQFEFECIPPFDTNRTWSLASASVQESADKLEAFCSYASNDLFGELETAHLGDYVRIANGMVSGLDKAFQIPDEVAGKLTEHEVANTYRVLKAKDMGKLSPLRYREYISIKSTISEKEFQREYPHFYALLNPYRTDLEKRYSYGRDLPFWEWAFKRSESFFSSPVNKIFVPCKERLTSREFIRFSLVKGDIIATQDVTAIAPNGNINESLEYIYGFLILPMVTDWVRVRGLLKGGVAEFSERPLSEIPFRPIDWTDSFEVEMHEKIKNRVSTSMIRCDFLELRKDINELFRTLGNGGQ